MNATVLTDQFSRRIDYIRLSVTDRCDLRCSYCMPEGSRGFDTRGTLAQFRRDRTPDRRICPARRSRIRLTGGEPLLRRDITELSGVSAAWASKTCRCRPMPPSSTARARLKAAGVTRLNVSLDSLQQARVEKINGRDVLAKVMAGLAAAQDAGFAPIKLNMVALAGTNDDEIDEMVAFCMQRGFVLRLIEAMPMGDHRPQRRIPRPAASEGTPPHAIQSGRNHDARRRTRALPGHRGRPLQRRLHHAHVAALLPDLQPHPYRRRRHRLHVPGPG
jgi:cyclic pyranopterin phosphate synthase